MLVQMVMRKTVIYVTLYRKPTENKRLELENKKIKSLRQDLVDYPRLRPPHNLSILLVAVVLLDSEKGKSNINIGKAD